MKVKTLNEYEILIKQKKDEEAKIIIMQQKSDISFIAGEFSFEHKTERILFKNEKNVVLFKKLPSRLKEMIEKELAILVIMEISDKTIKTGRGNIYFPAYQKTP